ncbi:MAG: hypothetical protein FJ117_24060, partial [Deltaproteobacteria bacterium]|nr:hypothetical protein [Deltaproteobacteria bacterium]
MVSAPATVYRPRNPQSSDYYRCVENHLETFIEVYEERFERRYGFWRPYLQKVITRYLECGDLHHGFARVKCPDCNHEYLLALTWASYCTSSDRVGTMTCLFGFGVFRLHRLV